MAWNQPGSSNNNPWGKKPAAGGDLDQAFKEWQKRIESLFGGGGGRSSMPADDHRHPDPGRLDVDRVLPGQDRRAGRGAALRRHDETVGDGLGWRFPWPIETVTKVNVQGV